MDPPVAMVVGTGDLARDSRSSRRADAERICDARETGAYAQPEGAEFEASIFRSKSDASYGRWT